MADNKSVDKVQRLNPQGKTMGQINEEFNVPSNAHPKLNYKVSDNVKLVPSAQQKKDNSPFKPTPGARQARKENEIKTQSLGILGGAHMGGHSDVSTAINLGGFTVKTPIVKPSSTKNK